MTEWSVVGVIVVLVGLFATILKPLYTQASNTATMVNEIKTLNENIKNLKYSSDKEHEKLWEKSEEHDKAINDHENRIQLIEHGKDVGNYDR